MSEHRRTCPVVSRGASGRPRPLNQVVSTHYSQSHRHSTLPTSDYRRLSSQCSSALPRRSGQALILHPGQHEASTPADRRPALMIANPVRRNPLRRSVSSSLVLLCCVFVLALLCGPVSATEDPEVWQRSTELSARRLERSSHLLFDRSEPPVAPRLIARRQNDEPSSSTELVFTLQTSPPTPTSKSAGTTTTVVVSTTSAVPSDLTTSTTLPQPFDSNLGSNFTQKATCPAFFNSFLQSQAFQACLPFSLLLQTSKSFFDAAHSFVRITQILDATCNVNVGKCNALMADLANKIRLDSTCGQDYKLENPYVRQAFNGFVTYKIEYEAGCAKDSKGSYCFANAITNTTSPADAYIYYIPLDNALTGGSRPTCNSCLEKTMNIFAPGAANSTLPLSRTYPGAASAVNMNCGPNFVNSTVSASGAGRMVGGGNGAGWWVAGLLGLGLVLL